MKKNLDRIGPITLPCALFVVAWRALDRQMTDLRASQPQAALERAGRNAQTDTRARGSDRPPRTARPQFGPVFDHFAANLAFWGALAWCADQRLQLFGAVLVIAFAAVCIRKGLRSAQELFAVYAVAYGALGLGLILGGWGWSALASASSDLVLVISAAGALWWIHERLRRRKAGEAR